MGRHSSHEQSPFLRSLAGWVLPWLLVAAVAGVAVWVGLDALTGDLEAKPPSSGGQAPPQSSTPRPTRTPESSPTPDPSPSKTEPPEPKPGSTKDPKPLITDGISVQVLNASTAQGAEEDMAARLERLGFQVVVTGGANSTYERTTVFWSVPSAEAAARRLARRFDWVAAPKPGNLSTSVDLHVIVGTDEG